MPERFLKWSRAVRWSFFICRGGGVGREELLLVCLRQLLYDADDGSRSKTIQLRNCCWNFFSDNCQQQVKSIIVKMLVGWRKTVSKCKFSSRSGVEWSRAEGGGEDTRDSYSVLGFWMIIMVTMVRWWFWWRCGFLSSTRFLNLEVNDKDSLVASPFCILSELVL